MAMYGTRNDALLLNAAHALYSEVNECDYSRSRSYLNEQKSERATNEYH